MTALRNRPALALLSLVVLAFAFGCKSEEELSLNSDGSGHVTAKIIVEPDYESELLKLQARAVAAGWQVGQKADVGRNKLLLLTRDFARVSELSTDDNVFIWSESKSGNYRKNYSLTIVVPETKAPLYERTINIRMPGSIVSSGGGKVNHDMVMWEASTGGRITVVTSQLVLPLTRNQMVLIGVGVLVLVGLIVLVVKLRKPPGRKCESCGAPIADEAFYCHLCGHGLDEEAAAAKKKAS